jgi:hypothetical protein
MNKLIILLTISLFNFCQDDKKPNYSRESEMVAFCNALNVPTKELTKVLYVPYSQCSACQLSSKAIFSDTTSLLYVIHFNEWQGKIDDEKFIYKNFGDYYPSDFGIITPYPVLFTFYEDNILEHESLF